MVLTAVAQRPGDLLLAEVCRHDHGEHAPMAARLEVRRLPLVGGARGDRIVGADRDLERLFRISVEVAEGNAEGAVGILVPAFERWSDGLASGADRRKGLLRAGRCS